MLAAQDCKLMAKRHDFELQIRAAAKPSSKPGEQRRDVCEHIDETIAPTFRTLTVSPQLVHELESQRKVDVCELVVKLIQSF
jgi:hypothetical protein